LLEFVISFLHEVLDGLALGRSDLVKLLHAAVLVDDGAELAMLEDPMPQVEHRSVFDLVLEVGDAVLWLNGDVLKVVALLDSTRADVGSVELGSFLLSSLLLHVLLVLLRCFLKYDGCVLGVAL
jgi:hypothetical protein